jgi:hypothetical protein
MNTANQAFRRAIRVRRSDSGQYEFATTRDGTFRRAVSYQGCDFEWEVIETLTGWGDWTHAISVAYGDRIVYYFVRP